MISDNYIYSKNWLKYIIVSVRSNNFSFSNEGKTFFNFSLVAKLKFLSLTNTCLN